MRALVAEYQQFKGSAEFRRLGFSARGPFAAWSERVQELQDRPGYAASLLSRCDVVPLDLWNAGADAYSSRATAWRVGIEAKFAACFRR
ncbi:MAG: hypothetical protein JNM89_09280 [Hyphomicrobiaceae bacterium]|nr:hypothetical protein [Hyphomicrobiaceae bacterium]